MHHVYEKPYLMTSLTLRLTLTVGKAVYDILEALGILKQWGSYDSDMLGNYFINHKQKELVRKILDLFNCYVYSVLPHRC